MRLGRSTRRAFTLVELFVVIAIILVIIGLMFPIFLSTWQNAQDTKTVVEISKLDEACETFKSIFGKYPPGRIMLCETREGYRQAIVQYLCQTHYQYQEQNQRGLAMLAKLSMEYLQSIFPGIDFDEGHDWNGDGIIDDRQYFLQGDEALTYFLGGMRYGPGARDVQGTNRSPPRGFNTDKAHPTRPSTGVPSVPKCCTPAPTRNVIPAPANRPTDVVKANALPRQSVEYCSGSHNVYIAKLAPPTPSAKRTGKNIVSALALR